MMDGDRRIVKFPTYEDDNGVLTCPKCGCQDFFVSNTDRWKNGFKKRRRVCENCSFPIITMEIVNDGLSSNFGG